MSANKRLSDLGEELRQSGFQLDVVLLFANSLSR
jgi:hypothetical protein